MNVVVVGMGETGRYITGVLTREGHNVTVVDNNPQAIAEAEELFDVLVLSGHAASNEVLSEIDIEQCDLFIAVTNDSDVNLISAARAAEAGAKKTVARVEDTAYFERSDLGIKVDFLGIDLVINPQILAAQEIHKIVRSISALSVEGFANNTIEVIQLSIDEETKGIGLPLMDLPIPVGSLVVAIVREGKLIVPRGIDTYAAGDDLYIVGLAELMSEVEKVFGRRRKQFTRRVMIVGGGNVGMALAQMLEEDDIDLVLIDRDRKRCEEIAQVLHRSVILHGDGTDAELLEEENVDSVDFFIAVSMEDEVNLMASLLARDLGCNRCIALVHKPDYTSVCERLGIHSTISPRITVAKQVLRYVREGEVLNVHGILEGAGEFIEFLVPAEAKVIGKPLKEVSFPKGAVVCAGLGKEGTFVPRGEHVLMEGDHVVVFCLPEVRMQVERFFRKPLFG
jgi:trk system potassium uptake protein TrkA